MNNTKKTLVFGFALFAGFFGAGNLILPPFLGFNAGPDWWLVAIGFLISTSVIPLLAILAHAKLQGSMFDFGKKVSPLFSTVFCFCMLFITIALPCPRTAAVAHEIAIDPFFGTSALSTSIIYFLLVFLFVINRSSVLTLIGKYLTPIIVFLLLTIIGLGIANPVTEITPSNYKYPVISGLLEGYQTYDAMAGVIMGGVVLVSLNHSSSVMSFDEKKKMIIKSGLIAMAGLCVIYVGLISVGAFFNSEFDSSVSRIEVLSGMATKTLGNFGAISLSVLVTLACFTTAVAIIVSVADFFETYFNKNNYNYKVTAVVCCLVGVVMGQMDVKYIIDIALPALMFIYPLCIVLILLNVLPDQFASPLVFKWVVFVTFIFSIPDVLGFVISTEKIIDITSKIPLANENLGWLLPATISFIVANVYEKLS